MGFLTNSNYGRKTLFSEILSRNLKTYIFKVDAFYESVSRNQIMSINISGDRTVHLGINISFKGEKIFSSCSDPIALSIAFRAYFIINYLHCMESAKEALPTSFFSGLVILESISDLILAKKRIVFIPDTVGINKNLRPIDVHCAIRAMIKVLIDYKSFISDEAVRLCEAYIDTLITYTEMPEIEYVNSKHAQYTVLCEINVVKSLVSQHLEAISEYALFRQIEFKSLESLNIDELLSACDINNNPFWPETIMRMLAITKDDKNLKKLLKHPSMRSSYLNFCANSVECFFQTKESSILLKENWLAVQQLVREIEQLPDFNLNLTNGMVHYIK